MTAANEPQILEPGPLLPPAKKASTIPEPDAAAAKDLPKITPPKVADAAVQSDAKAEPQISPSRQINHKESSAQKEAQTLTVKLKVPRMEKTARHGLPLMLSPLSSDIEEELAKRTPTPSIRGDASSAEKAKASKDSLNGTPSSNEKLPASKVLQKTTAKSASTFTKGPQELKGVTSAPHQGGKDLGLEKVIATKPTSNGIANASKGVSSPIVKATVPEAPRKLRLRVTLPIKKKTNRKTLVQYLRMKPTPGKYPSGMRQETHTEVPRSEIKQIEDKASQKRNEPEASRAGEKRRRLQEDHDENRLEPPIKRQKGPGGLPQKTHTPKQSSISSPALSHLGSAQKTYLSTPDVGLTSTPMMRAGSGGSSVYTPHQLAMNCTPAAPDTGNSRTSTNLPAASKPKSGDLRAEAKRFTETGVHLKHDADRFFKNPGGMSDVERKQGVVFGIESVLCFMLSFTFSEMGMPNGDRMSWKSILPFLTKVNEEAPSVKHLAGLALQLESIIRDILVHIDSQRLARNPLDDYFNNPETADPAKTKEQNKTAEFALQFAELRRNADKAQSTLRASWAYLNLEEIRIQFPNTWAKREEIRHPLGKGLETIKAGDYKRTVTLPVSSTTSKLEAVNFGVSILAEFCHKDGMEWQPKLVL